MRVTEMIGFHFPEFEDQINEELRIMDDLGADDIDILDIELDVEDEFEITVEYGFVINACTIGGVIDQLFEIINR